MARIRGSVKQTDVNYSKFLGLYEAPDGDTQMKNGVSPEMENFQITESFHLKTRPGIVPYKIIPTDDPIKGARCRGYFSDETLEIAIFDNTVYRRLFSANTTTSDGWVSLGEIYFPPIHRRPFNGRPSDASIFAFGDRYYIITGRRFYWWDGRSAAVSEVVGYVPLVVTGAAPSGGGTTLERVNLLTNQRRAQYSADGTSKRFVLPEQIERQEGETLILSVTVDGAAVTWTEVSTEAANTYAAELATAPAKGVNNVEITYQNPRVDDRTLITRCCYCEKFNGATDSRLFVYDGNSNIIRYSEPTLSGEATGAYFAALNEIKIGDASSPVTALQRHYGRLMAFKPDGCYAVAYDTLTLPDGTVTAGFYVRTMHRSLGSDAAGQICVVQNFPRTFCKGCLYDWKQTASYYQDERYAKVASEPVQFSAQEAAPGILFLYDDDDRRRFYLFLNDEAGTVLVNAYEQGVWFKYTGFQYVTAAGRGKNGALVFAMQHGGVQGLFALDDAHTYDYTPVISAEAAITGYTREPISCRWESGHMDFGRSNTRKYSSYIWVTLKPGRHVRAWLTAQSDRRPSYAVGNAVTGLFDETDFADFTFETYEVPRARRLKIKVKKFVFYKLLIGCDGGEETTVPEIPERTDGAVTVLSVDQRVRFTSDAK